MQGENPEITVEKTALPIVAGILTLVSGGLKLLGILGVMVVALVFAVAPRNTDRIYSGAILGFIALCLLITGVLAIIGGIYSTKRKSWAWSLTGAIASFLPFNLLGLTSIILLAMSKKEFES